MRLEENAPSLEEFDLADGEITMNKYKKMNAARSAKNKSQFSAEAIQLRRRIIRNRKRARNVGLLYLLATIALTAAAFLPLVTHELAYVGVTQFYKAFFDLDFTTVDGLVKVITAALYVMLLLVVVINLFKSLGKLKWLYKKNANRTYGFNRNLYAMQDMAAIFSGSFAFLVIVYFLVSLLCGITITFTQAYFPLLIVVGAGVVLRLFTGFLGAKTGYFDIEEKEVVEQKREIGRFVPVLRNLLQLVATFGILLFTLKVNEAQAIFTPLMEEGGLQELMENIMDLVVIVLQILAVLCTFVLIKHATAATEYNFDGVKGAGMKNYRVFAFFVFLLAGGAALVEKFMLEKDLNINLLIVAGIAFAAFVIELILRKRPKARVETKKNEQVVDEDGEITMDALSREYVERKPTEEEQLAPVPTPVAPQAAYTQQPEYGAASQTTPYLLPQQAPQAHTYFIPYPMPYPQQPTATPVREEEKEEEEKVVLPQEPLRVEVDCPTCGKRLIINQAVTYHRCPSCQKIFTAQTVERFAKPEV